MPIPDFQTLMLPVLKLANEKQWSISAAVARLADQFELSDEERNSLLPSGKQSTFANRVGWAKSYLLKAGLVSAPARAQFTITAAGKKALQNPPERITIGFLEQYPEFKQYFKQYRPDSKDKLGAGDDIPKSPSLDADLTPDEAMRQGHKRLEESLAQEMLKRIQSGTPKFFELLVVRLLFAMGYGGSVSEINKSLTGKSGDGGVDGVIDQDILGLDRVYIQAKKYASDAPIGAPAIRDFFGSLDAHKASKGLFVTTSSYSKKAFETAASLTKRIVLIDGQQLAQMMIRHSVGCRAEETLVIKVLDEDFFEE